MQNSFEESKCHLTDRIVQTLKLDTPNKQGESRRQTLEFNKKQLAKFKTPEQLDVIFDELKPVQVHRSVMHLLSVFARLSNRRTMGMSGPNPLSFGEIKAMCELTGEQLDSWEVEMILSMDSAYISQVHKMME